MSTFLDRFAPTTSELGFIEAQLELVSESYCAWQGDIVRPLGGATERTELSEPLEAMLHRLDPLVSVYPTRYLFVATAGPWTAFFDNSVNGPDPLTLSFVAEKLKCRLVRAVSIPDTLGNEVYGRRPGQYGATIFELHEPNPAGLLTCSRAVSVVNDGGSWRFDTVGDPLPFEELGRFKVNPKQARFTHTDLERYLRVLGIDAFNEHFYEPRGALVMRNVRVEGQQERALSEVRAALGLRSFQ